MEKERQIKSVKRFFVKEIEGQRAVLSGEEFLHAKQVLRIKQGEEVLLFNGDGKEYRAIVCEMHGQQIVCEIQQVCVSDRECKTHIKMLLCYLKGDKTELAVQKATELGVYEIAIFSSKNCSAYMNENKLLRLQKVAQEAAKQCKRAVVPQVIYYASLQEALASCSNYQNKIFACEFANTSAINLHTLSGSTAFVIGSEGGFTQEELELAKSYQFSEVSLGKRILRAETAAIALMSIVAFGLHELEGTIV